MKEGFMMDTSFFLTGIQLTDKEEEDKWLISHWMRIKSRYRT
jgi:hypothetical protein